MDQCEHCVVQGQIEECEETPCTIHEAWYVKLLKTRLAKVKAQRDMLRELVDAASLAIDEHNAPGDCYATGPLTGNDITDLFICPACRFIAMREELAKLEENSKLY